MTKRGEMTTVEKREREKLFKGMWKAWVGRDNKKSIETISTKM